MWLIKPAFPSFLSVCFVHSVLSSSLKHPVSAELCLCAFRYMSVVALEENSDCHLLAVACSDGALRSEPKKMFLNFVSGASCCPDVLV